MKCYYCENAPAGICRWCGKFYCEKHGSRGCHECSKKLDSLTSAVYDKKYIPVYFGIFIGLMFFISGAWNELQDWLSSTDSVDPNVWWFLLAYSIVLIISFTLYDKTVGWKESKSLLISLLAYILWMIVGGITGVLISPFSPLWLLNVGKLIWFLISGKS